MKKENLLEKLKAAMESTDVVSPVVEMTSETTDVKSEDTNADMAMSDLRTIIRNAQELHDMMTEDMTLPSWIAGKITLASDYIGAAADYMKSESTETEEPGEVDEMQLQNTEVSD
jgi:hypothetical protein